MQSILLALSGPAVEGHALPQSLANPDTEVRERQNGFPFVGFGLCTRVCALRFSEARGSVRSRSLRCRSKRPTLIKAGCARFLRRSEAPSQHECIFVSSKQAVDPAALGWQARSGRPSAEHLLVLGTGYPRFPGLPLIAGMRNRATTSIRLGGSKDVEAYADRMQTCAAHLGSCSSRPEPPRLVKVRRNIWHDSSMPASRMGLFADLMPSLSAKCRS